MSQNIWNKVDCLFCFVSRAKTSQKAKFIFVAVLQVIGKNCYWPFKTISILMGLKTKCWELFSSYQLLCKLVFIMHNFTVLAQKLKSPEQIFLGAGVSSFCHFGAWLKFSGEWFQTTAIFQLNPQNCYKWCQNDTDT